VDPARSENHGMYGTSMRENREIPGSPAQLITGRAVQGTRRGTPEMHERGKSDRPVVPANLSNKAAAAEVGEERGRAKGNTAGKTHPGHSAGRVRRVRWVVCVRWHDDIRVRGLPRCCTTSPSADCGRRTGRLARRRRPGWMG
jgi:hypothetical protein